MRVEKKGDGVWCASYKHADGKVSIGFDEDFETAMRYCWELVIDHG